MFINHQNAKSSFNKIVKKEKPNWIVISGGENSGKTSFVKEVCISQKVLFCETQLDSFYLKGFVAFLEVDFDMTIKQFLCQNAEKLKIIRDLSNKTVNYINDINEEISSDIIVELMKDDISDKKYKYAKYLGNKLLEKYSFIVLDDFYKCDKDSYEWILNLAEKFINSGGHIIAICDFEKQWRSNLIYTNFRNIPSLIDIKYFENENDYFDVLKENIYFDNFENLRQISKDLFQLYDGDAQSLFKTIKLYKKSRENGILNDENYLLTIANNLTLDTFQNINKIEQIVLSLLAISPIPLSTNEISEIIDINNNIVQEILIKQYNNNAVEKTIRQDTSSVCYQILYDSTKRVIQKNISLREKEFLLTRIYNMEKSKRLRISMPYKIDIALSINSKETEHIMWNYFKQREEFSEERKIEYINTLYSKDLNLQNLFSNYQNAKLLHEYGYFDSALKIVNYIIDIGTNVNYKLLMLLGSIQHLLLLPEAPKTFEMAAKLENITVSQKLSAINREIMSLNQSSITAAQEAKRLYKSTLEKYKDVECEGLIELYRNTNNSFSLEDSLEYTIKGYNLALKLGNELEKYKCIHNICMIRLHQNKYNDLMIRNDLSITPTFELVDNYFAQNTQLFHKRAYPLLNMGTIEMFKYVADSDIKHLKTAKSYYSKAQLFAKTFYARNIAEMSLLIVNTYLYYQDENIANIIKEKRSKIFSEFQDTTIVDYRVNRKILLSLSLSAIITSDINEASKYLHIAKPYISGPETVRYENMLSLCVGTKTFEMQNWIDEESLYYECPYFVPWLISLAH